MKRKKEIENQIKEYFSKFTQIQRQCVKIFLDKNPKIEQYLNDFLSAIPEWLNIQNIIAGIVKDFDLPKCKICGKIIKYKRTMYRKLPQYCSSKCSNSDINIKQKISDKVVSTCMQRYGVRSTSSIPEIVEKQKKTALKNGSHKKAVLKIKETLLKRYGSSTYNNFEKFKQTCIIKYGVDNPNKLKEISQKVKAKLNKHYFEKMVKRYKKYVKINFYS